jgi:hypothetical protein
MRVLVRVLQVLLVHMYVLVCHPVVTVFVFVLVLVLDVCMVVLDVGVLVGDVAMGVLVGVCGLGHRCLLLRFAARLPRIVENGTLSIYMHIVGSEKHEAYAQQRQPIKAGSERGGAAVHRTHRDDTTHRAGSPCAESHLLVYGRSHGVRQRWGKGWCWSAR